MAALWTSLDAARATGGHAQGQAWMASGVAIDSRELRPGDLFVALQAERDGHDFVRSAFDVGAAAALVAKDVPGLPADAPLLKVGDTLDGLRALAAAARNRSGAIRVGVTGSVGKTTTKALLAAALSAFGATHAAARSFNNHWGVPLTLARMPAESAYGVFEMGMNAAGEIAALTDIVRPQAAVVTAIAPAHLEKLGSLEAIARAKAEIFDGLPEGALAVIPETCDHHDVLRAAAAAKGARILTFGEGEGAELRLLETAPEGEGQRVRAAAAGREVSFTLPMAGAHNAMNACAAFAVVHGLGLGVETAAAALAHVRGEAGRGRAERLRLPDGDITLIDDSYNANPASVRAALAMLAARAPGPGGRRIAVLGDMAELGKDAERLHAGLKDAARAADVVHGAGALTQALGDALEPERRGLFAEDASALAPRLLADLRAGDVVLVKGSRSSAMERAADAIRAVAARKET